MPEKESYISNEQPENRVENSQETESLQSEASELQETTEADVSPELDEVRKYIEQEKQQEETTETSSKRANAHKAKAGEYEWLTSLPPDERPEKAYQDVLKQQVRMVEAVDAFLSIEDYAGLDRFSEILRERYDELADAGLVSSVTKT